MNNDSPLWAIGCSRFHTCSVAVCPLDPDLEKRKHLAGERICPFIYKSFRNEFDEIPSSVLDAINEKKWVLKAVLRHFWDIALKKALEPLSERFLKWLQDKKKGTVPNERSILQVSLLEYKTKSNTEH